MARLLQVFGFLSVLFRGATLTFLSLAISGIVFLLCFDLREDEHSFTLQQAVTAGWLGGLPYLLIAIRRAPTPEFARQLSARFSQLALVSVAVLASAGLVLGFAYVGSFRAIYGTSYGAMVATKALLFGILLFLGALNFQLVRRGPASSILASLKRFGGD